MAHGRGAPQKNNLVAAIQWRTAVRHRIEKRCATDKLFCTSGDAASKDVAIVRVKVQEVFVIFFSTLSRSTRIFAFVVSRERSVLEPMCTDDRLLVFNGHLYF